MRKTTKYNNAFPVVFRATLAILLLILAACSTVPSALKMDEQGNYLGIYVVYDERESSANPTMFQTEISILPHRILIKDNRNKSGFILVDREKKIIYNVNHADKTIMEIRSQPVKVKSPIPIEYTIESQPSGAIPRISDMRATHYRINVNGKQCYNAVSAEKNFFPEVAVALSEFRQILAGEHAKSVNSIPHDLLDACDLALNIFNASDYLQYGFPLREWDQNGYLRFIRFFRKNYKMKPDAFELPKNYETYSIP